MNKMFTAVMLLCIVINCHASELFKKDTPDILCKDINVLSKAELAILITGARIGATAEGISVSSFTKFGLENKDDYSYVKGVAWSSYGTMDDSVLFKKINDTCTSKENTDRELLDIIIEHITSTLIAENSQ